MIVEGVSSPNMNAGAVTKTGAVKRNSGVYTRGVSGKTATRGDMGTTAATPASPLCPHGHRKQEQAKRRYGQPAPHTDIIAQF